MILPLKSNVHRLPQHAVEGKQVVQDGLFDRRGDLDSSRQIAQLVAAKEESFMAASSADDVMDVVWVTVRLREGLTEALRILKHELLVR